MVPTRSRFFTVSDRPPPSGADRTPAPSSSGWWVTDHTAQRTGVRGHSTDSADAYGHGLGLGFAVEELQLCNQQRRCGEPPAELSRPDRGRGTGQCHRRGAPATMRHNHEDHHSEGFPRNDRQ